MNQSENDQESTLHLLMLCSATHHFSESFGNCESVQNDEVRVEDACVNQTKAQLLGTLVTTLLNSNENDESSDSNNVSCTEFLEVNANTSTVNDSLPNDVAAALLQLDEYGPEVAMNEVLMLHSKC